MIKNQNILRPDKHLKHAHIHIAVPAPIQFLHINQNTRLVFTHVPRTGGTTLREIFIGIQRQKAWPGLEIMGRPYHTVHYEKSNLIKDFLAISEEDRRKLHYVYGHIPFGLHRIEGEQLWHVALIREPVERSLSTYKFYVQNAYMPGTIGARTFFTDGYFIDNIHTRMIAGVLDAKAKCTSATLAEAKRNMSRHYALVADHNRHDDFVALLLSLTGSAPLMYPRRNATLPTVINADIENELRLEALDHNQYDNELYESVKGKVFCQEFAELEKKQTLNTIALKELMERCKRSGATVSFNQFSPQDIHSIDSL